MANEQKIWDFLVKELGNEYGAAGLMGNLYAESALNPQNLQNSYEKKFGMSDSEYTTAVDNGTYTKFATDAGGYGLAQWTYKTRKQNLLNYAKKTSRSIGDLQMQLEFLMTELQSYSSVLKALKTATSVKEASNVVLLKFEKPADQSAAVQTKRASYGQKYYDTYATKQSTTQQQEEVKVTMADYSKYINSTGTHYISNCGSDENKKYHGGKAGDQTGHEWELKAWYNRPWNYVYRYEKDSRVGMTLANLACGAAQNNNIGYDQYERTTYYTQLKANNYDPTKISKKCESDCSCGVMSNVKATGYLLGIQALKDISYTCTTSTMRSALKKAGFTEYSDSKYLKSGNYLLPGDILLKVGSHTATNITKGKNAPKIDTSVTTPSAPAQPSIPTTPTNANVIGIATATGNMYVRSEASTKGSSLGVIKKGESVEVVEINSSGWYKIVWGNGYGYTSNSSGSYYTYTAIPKPTPPAGVDMPQAHNSAAAGTWQTTGNINVRAGAGTNKSILTVIPRGTIVTATGDYTLVSGTPWLYVSFTYKGTGYTGYASNKYLAKI